MKYLFSIILPLMACLLLSFSYGKKPARVVFFGDSITEAGIKPGGYIAQMADSLAVQNKSGLFNLIGAGISGNKIYDLYFRLESDVLAQKPNTVVIYVGVNDVWHKQTFGTGTDADKFKKFYSAIIDRLQKKKIRVILCTPACIGEKKNKANPLDKELDDFAQIIRDLAQEKNCQLADFRKAFVDYQAEMNASDRYSSILTTDGVHLNAKGNQMVANMLLLQLAQPPFVKK